jgi:hypothetical protein
MAKRIPKNIVTPTYSVQDVRDYSTPQGASLANEEMRRLAKKIAEVEAMQVAPTAAPLPTIPTVTTTNVVTERVVIAGEKGDKGDAGTFADIDTLQASIEALPKFNEIALSDMMLWDRVKFVEDSIGNGLLTITRNGSTLGTFSANQTAGATIDIPIQTIPDPPTPNNGVLTIRRNGADIASFSANQAGSSIADISVPSQITPNNGTLSLRVNSVELSTFTADQAGSSTFNVTLPTVNNQPLTLQVNGTTQTTFYANDDTPRTFNVVVPSPPTVNNGSLSLRVNGAEQTNFTANDSGAKIFDVTLPTLPTVNNGTLSLRVNGAEQTNFTANDSGAKVFDVTLPTLPTVNDGLLTIRRNGTVITTFSANQSGSNTADISVPDPYTHPSFSAISLKGSTTRVARVARDAEGHIGVLDEVDISFPVTSVNGQTGAVTISTGSTYTHPALSNVILNAETDNGALYFNHGGITSYTQAFHTQLGTEMGLNVRNNTRFVSGVVKEGNSTETGSAPTKAWACVGNVPDWRPTKPLVGSTYIKIRDIGTAYEIYFDGGA